jgi:hypothetical protein
MDRRSLSNQEISDLTWAESPPNIAKKNTMKKVNFEELESLKKSQEWLLVKFSGVACSPCIRMTDILNQVTPKYPQMTVIEADAMENMEELINFGLGKGVPQTFLYHNGVAVNIEKPFHLLGLKSTEDVDKVLSHFIQ